MTDWQTPNPGPWQQDSAHAPAAGSAAVQSLYPDGFNRGFTETFQRYGLLLDRIALAVINGFTYHQPQPFDMPGPDGPLSPEEIGAEIGRRAALAEEAFASKLWRRDLELWDTDCKPQAIARHRELGDVDLAALDDQALVGHLRAVAGHVTEMAYQHHRFNVAAMLPLGDLALHVIGWTGRSPSEILGMLDGYSPVTGAAPTEMRDALDALRPDADARALLTGAGDPGDRLAELRTRVPEVDDYVRGVAFRLVEGFDILGPTLIEQPEVILGKLSAGLDADTESIRRRADALAEEIRAEVPAEHREEFDELVGEARAVYRLRDERGIHSDISSIGLLRLALLEVGRRAVERGDLDERDQILDATVDEAIALLGGDGPAAAELAARGDRRRTLSAQGAPRYLGPPPPEPPPLDQLPPALARVMGGVGFMIDGILGQLDAAEGDESSVVGIGVAGPNGAYEGVARRIDQIDDLFDLEEGEIVVTKSTGEAFNSMLHLVGGIVTDHGSFACHATIMAREIGFPAVVGTVNATQRIATGDRIRIDGEKGVVTLL